jgi:hypothetical protein
MGKKHAEEYHTNSVVSSAPETGRELYKLPASGDDGDGCARRGGGSLRRRRAVLIPREAPTLAGKTESVAMLMC